MTEKKTKKDTFRRGKREKKKPQQPTTTTGNGRSAILPVTSQSIVKATFNLLGLGLGHKVANYLVVL